MISNGKLISFLSFPKLRDFFGLDAADAVEAALARIWLSAMMLLDVGHWEILGRSRRRSRGFQTQKAGIMVQGWLPSFATS